MSHPTTTSEGERVVGRQEQTGSKHQDGRSTPAGTEPVIAAGEFALARREVEQLIEKLQRSGALDEGTADVLDRLIDAWHGQQANRLDAYFLDRRRDMQRNVSRADEALRRAELRRDLARGDLARLRGANSSSVDTGHPDAKSGAA